MKTKLKKKLIVSIIKKDASLQKAYSGDGGRFCVIGGLLHEAGFDVQANIVDRGLNTDPFTNLDD